jgi:CMP-N-acetylneuraminic acid synthetase
MKKDILALIPARGGSKGIPRKNIRILAGHPLISYSIKHALSSKLITRTIVSTDDSEIADVARTYGAETPFLRPAKYARDSSLDVEVFRHALKWLEKHENYVPEIVVHLRPTGPVRNVALIDKAIKLMLNTPKADALKSVNRPKHTPYKMWKKEKNGFISPLLNIPGKTEPHCFPRQKLPQVFWQNGYVDIVRSRVILKSRLMYGKYILPFFIHEASVDIDTEADLKAAEYILKDWKKKPVSMTISDLEYSN